MKYNYTNSLFAFRRNDSLEVDIKGVKIGGANPVVVQSMGVTSSLNIPLASQEAIRIIEAGGQMVRFTAASVAEAKGVGQIKETLNEQGYFAPIIADVHFNPRAAFEAARVCDKVRINPGNFATSVAKGAEYTQSEYESELAQIKTSLIELLGICKQHNTALRIGVNHGSLSARVLSKHGNTPEGMVVSAIEFLTICHSEGFDNVVVSMKSSSTPTMVRAYRLLSSAMRERGFAYPLHLGVTEAGEGSDGRVRSAVGIGALLADGLGDTIRVSLTEAPEREIAVAKELIGHFAPLGSAAAVIARDQSHYYPYSHHRWESSVVAGVGGAKPPVVVGHDMGVDDLPLVYVTNATLSDELLGQLAAQDNKVVVVESQEQSYVHDMRAAILAMRSAGVKLPIILKFGYSHTSLESLSIAAAADAGVFFVDGMANGLWIESPAHSQEELSSLALSILQASASRISNTEYISCPGCGRTLFDIQSRVRQVKERTGGLGGVKIAVMGCIVNGPGEMADADYGYVGAGKGRVVLYRRGEPVGAAISEDSAVDALIALIEEDK